MSMKNILTVFLFLFSKIVSADAEPIMAGFGAEGGEDHLRNFSRYGMNAQFWSVRNV